MNKLRRSCAAVALSLTFTVSAFAGILHSPGAVEPPPPPPSEQTSTSTSSVTMIESSQIDRMSVTERLQAMDQLWESLNRCDEIPSLDWYQDVLTDRKARAERGEAKFLTLDQLRSRLRSFER
jgi:hypothetical protein